MGHSAASGEFHLGQNVRRDWTARSRPWCARLGLRRVVRQHSRARSECYTATHLATGEALDLIIHLCV